MMSESSHGLDPAVLEQILERGRRMVSDGLVLGTSGNISLRHEDGFVITPSTVPYDEITIEDLVWLDADGVQVGGRGRPSAETPMHLAVYAVTDARAVVHTHAPSAVAVSTVLDELPAIHYDIGQLGGHSVPIVGYERFGSGELADRTAAAIEDRSAAILRNHGTITCGTDLRQAYHRAQLVEWLASVYLQARSIGEPALLGEDEMAAVLAESRSRRYGAVAS